MSSILGKIKRKDAKEQEKKNPLSVRSVISVVNINFVALTKQIFTTEITEHTERGIYIEIFLFLCDFSSLRLILINKFHTPTIEIQYHHCLKRNVVVLLIQFLLQVLDFL